jgi:NAD(P)-dependent dehydrogenase (short-subunit alcohol dehydrogenase family)
LAKEHAAVGDALVLLARRRDRLKSVAEACRNLGAAKVALCVGDVTRRVDVQRAAKAAAAMGGLDIAYANAGYSQSGTLESMSLEDWRRQMEVNVEGVLHTVQTCVPMLKASRGRLAIVGSVTGFGSLADSGAYSASKAAVRALAQVLDLELAPVGISVTLVAPGFFASEIRKKKANGAPDPTAPEYIPRFLLGDPVKVARAVRKAVLRRKHELILPLHAKSAVFFLRHFPGLSQILARRLSRARLARRAAVQGRGPSSGLAKESRIR